MPNQTTGPRSNAHQKVDEAQARVDALDQKPDDQFDAAKAESVVFQGIDQFQDRMLKLKLPEAQQDEYLDAITKHLEALTGPETLQATMELITLQLENFEKGLEANQEMVTYSGDYLAGREKARSADLKDIENLDPAKYKEHAYAPFLLHMMEDFGDWEMDDAKEKDVAKQMVDAVSAGLDATKARLDQTDMVESPAYQALQKAYAEDLKTFVEVTANVGDSFESEAFREDAEKKDEQQKFERIAKYTQEAIRVMPLNEGIAWVKKLMKDIDANDWQSEGLKAAYGSLAHNARMALKGKLDEASQAIKPEETEKRKAHEQLRFDLAKLFTDRSGAIDSNLVDPDFSAELLKSTINFQGLALQYAEKQLQKNNPLKVLIVEKKVAVLTSLEGLPEEKKKLPQIQKALAIINGTPEDMKALSTQYATVRSWEAQINGEDPFPDIQTEVTEQTTLFMGEALQSFGEFLDSGATGASVESIEAATGTKFSPEQSQAYALLADIEGFGMLDLSDKTWNTTVEFAKVGAMIAAGVALGIATGGSGFAIAGSAVLGSAVVGGVGMTAAGAVLFQKGFDDFGEAAKIYGADLAVNAVGFGAARVLQAGRIALQLRRAGMMDESVGVASQTKEIFKMANQGGEPWKALMALDDSMHIGTRLIGASAESVCDFAVTSVCDTVVNTYILGEGAFLSNLSKAFTDPMNIGFLGAGLGMELSPAMVKKIRTALGKAEPETLHGMDQALNKASNAKQHLSADLREQGIAWKDFARSSDPESSLRKLPAEKQAAARAQLQTLKDAQSEFTNTFKTLDLPPNFLGVTAQDAKLAREGGHLGVLPPLPRTRGEALEALGAGQLSTSQITALINGQIVTGKELQDHLRKTKGHYEINVTGDIDGTGGIMTHPVATTPSAKNLEAAMEQIKAKKREAAQTPSRKTPETPEHSATPQERITEIESLLDRDDIEFSELQILRSELEELKKQAGEPPQLKSQPAPKGEKTLVKGEPFQFTMKDGQSFDLKLGGASQALKLEQNGGTITLEGRPLKPGETYQMGRDPRNHFKLEGDGVSRVHAKITVSPEGDIKIIDSSTNGTKLALGKGTGDAAGRRQPPQHVEAPPTPKAKSDLWEGERRLKKGAPFEFSMKEGQNFHLKLADAKRTLQLEQKGGNVTLEGRSLQPGKTYLIGRGKESDFKFEGEGVSRKHVEITISPEGRIKMVDLSANGTRLELGKGRGRVKRGTEGLTGQPREHHLRMDALSGMRLKEMMYLDEGLDHLRREFGGEVATRFLDVTGMGVGNKYLYDPRKYTPEQIANGEHSLEALQNVDESFLIQQKVFKEVFPEKGEIMRFGGDEVVLFFEPGDSRVQQFFEVVNARKKEWLIDKIGKDQYEVAKNATNRAAISKYVMSNPGYAKAEQAVLDKTDPQALNTWLRGELASLGVTPHEMQRRPSDLMELLAEKLVPTPNQAEKTKGTQWESLTTNWNWLEPLDFYKGSERVVSLKGSHEQTREALLKEMALGDKDVGWSKKHPGQEVPSDIKHPQKAVDEAQVGYLEESKGVQQNIKEVRALEVQANRAREELSRLTDQLQLEKSKGRVSPETNAAFGTKSEEVTRLSLEITRKLALDPGSGALRFDRCTSTKLAHIVPEVKGRPHLEIRKVDIPFFGALNNNYDYAKADEAMLRLRLSLQGALGKDIDLVRHGGSFYTVKRTAGQQTQEAFAKESSAIKRSMEPILQEYTHTKDPEKAAGLAKDVAIKRLKSGSRHEFGSIDVSAKTHFIENVDKNVTFGNLLLPRL